MKTVFGGILGLMLNLTVLCAFFVAFLLLHPNSPLPNAFHPLKPLRIDDPLTFVTRWKLDEIAQQPALCSVLLEVAATGYEEREDFTQSEACGISQRVFLSSIRKTTIGPIETQCHIALRIALWERHVVQPMAEAIYSEPVEEILTQGSYNCRTVRTEGGSATRMSEHATANAIDVRGFKLSSGREITLIDDWNGFDADRGFLRELRDGGCKVFNTTIGPDYNQLHADHFHLDAGPFRVCR
ncbi:MAG: extensin family protein [Pseudomonadota bacterium]